jgi:7-keto-8-aminopelargonate synthetase-like enzyme
MDSDVPDVAALQAICNAIMPRFSSIVPTISAHRAQPVTASSKTFDLVGKVDVLVGAFSKSFASMGGFVATNNKGFRFGLRGQCGPSTFTNAMSPVQAATILGSPSISSRARKAPKRRRKLMANSHAPCAQALKRPASKFSASRVL